MLTNSLRLKKALVFSLVCGLTPTLSCTNPKTHREPLESRGIPGTIDLNLEDSLTSSSIEIQYIVGHDRYLLKFKSQDRKPSGEYFHEKLLLDHGAINQERYFSFLGKGMEFIRTSNEVSSPQPTPCKNPYQVTIRVGNTTETTQGCRSAEAGRFSRLVRTGEFLLYSKKT